MSDLKDKMGKASNDIKARWNETKGRVKQAAEDARDNMEDDDDAS